METRERKELETILNNEGGNLYDFVCNNYYLLSKDELKDIAKEAVYLLYKAYEVIASNNGETLEQAEKNCHNELKEDLKENTTLFED